MVLVEADHRLKDLLGDSIDWSQLEWCNSDLHVAQFTDNRLDLSVIDTIQRLDYHKIVLLLGIFHNGRFDWSEMLLVRKIDMVQQWALSWQESTGELKRLRMPELRFSLFNRSIELHVFLHLDDKADFSRVTEV